MKKKIPTFNTDEEAENAVKKVLANLAEIGVELRS